MWLGPVLAVHQVMADVPLGLQRCPVASRRDPLRRQATEQALPLVDGPNNSPERLMLCRIRLRQSRYRNGRLTALLIVHDQNFYHQVLIRSGVRARLPAGQTQLPHQPMHSQTVDSHLTSRNMARMLRLPAKPRLWLNN